MMLTYFKPEEFDCKETGENKMNPLFLLDLDELRGRCGFPFAITSGFRSVKHSKETVKAKPGTHTEGIAADIMVSGGHQKYTLVKNALAMGFTGIGVGDTFIHVDKRNTIPVIWTY